MSLDILLSSIKVGEMSGNFSERLREFYLNVAFITDMNYTHLALLIILVILVFILIAILISTMVQVID